MHKEQHKQGENLSDIILGGQDGIVNTLGVILGIATASSDIRIILAGGLAAALAQSISMGAVAYTSTLAEAEYYESERQREDYEIEHFPDAEKEEIREIYAAKGLKGKLLDDVTEVVVSDRKMWLETMMRDELGLTPVSKNGAYKSAGIVFLSSFVGSLIPLIPFFLPLDLGLKKILSILFAAAVLFGFGAYKAQVTVGHWLRSGLQLMLIGVVSALAGYLVGAAFSL